MATATFGDEGISSSLPLQLVGPDYWNRGQYSPFCFANSMIFVSAG
jgi:hypothetical protein